MTQPTRVAQLDNQYRNAAPQPEDRVMSFQAQSIYIGDGDGVTYPSYLELVAACERQGAALPACRYLFAIGETSFFLAELGEVTVEGYHYHSLFELHSQQPHHLLLAGDTAWHLQGWYDANRHCGVCRTAFQHAQEERMLKCPACGNMAYPKIAPAVMIGVTDGSKIFMTKYAGREYTDYALIAGYVEIGETVEETVRREVEEAVGLSVQNITYYKSQPWGLTGLVFMGFFAQVEEGAEISLDEKELEEAAWIDAADLPDDEAPAMLAGEMLQHFRKQVLKEA